MKKRVKGKPWMICYNGVDRHPMDSKKEAQSLIDAVKHLPFYRKIKMTIRKVQS